MTAKRITPSPNVKKVVWDKTPVEQGLKVGDWIAIDGYQRTYIGAHAKIEKGEIVGLEWHDPDPNAMMKLGTVDVWSQPAEKSSTDSIIAILGFVDENTVGKIPIDNDDIVKINYAVKKWHDAFISYRPKVRITAQISQILDEPDYPNQWSLVCLKTGTYIQFLSEK
ncbi:MAG: hypothetical protein OXM61_18625 [Candidatus Poribacteria bacterium]|nr:hypothetical protein [Candidatus Poribacteria bacterium]